MENNIVQVMDNTGNWAMVDREFGMVKAVAPHQYPSVPIMTRRELFDSLKFCNLAPSRIEKLKEQIGGP